MISKSSPANEKGTMPPPTPRRAWPQARSIEPHGFGDQRIGFGKQHVLGRFLPHAFPADNHHQRHRHGRHPVQRLVDDRFIGAIERSEEHTSELQSLMRISYAVFCLKKKKNTKTTKHN